MKRIIVISLVMFLCGCGGGMTPIVVSSCAQQFVNLTSTPTSSLVTQFAEAQRNIATQPIILNALDIFYHGAAPRTVPSDPRALTDPRITTDRCLTVRTEPDVTVAELARITGNPNWLKGKDPSGAFMFGEIPVHSYLSANTVVMVASLSEKPGVYVYEFENWILKRLGYDTSNR